MWLDLDKLRIGRPALHRLVSQKVGFLTGIRVVDLDEYTSDVARGIQEWAAAAEQQIDLKAIEQEEQAAIQKAADEAAGRNRLAQYAQEQGLEDTPANAAAIKQWLQDNVKGYVSPIGINLAVQWLGRGPRARNVLTWRKPEAAPPQPPSTEPQEVLLTLSDGTTQLPLDVDNHTLQRASKEQARDYLKRVNAGKIIRPRGSFISSF